MSGTLKGTISNEFEGHVVLDVGRLRVQVSRDFLRTTPIGQFMLDENVEIEHVLPIPPRKPPLPVVYVSDTAYEKLQKQAIEKAGK